jgi:hypothetical protein
MDTPLPATRRQAETDDAGCRLCTADVIHCHEVSVEHVDGSTACADPWCNLPHHLHDWQMACDAFSTPCPCAAADLPYEIVLPRAA